MTSCFLAVTSSQYREAHSYMQSKGAKDCKLSFPTILAMREEEIVGVMGTRPYKKAILAGPMVANSRYVVLRLAEAYDKVMTVAGIHSYIFESRKEDEKWLTIIDRLPGFYRTGEGKNKVRYERRLVEGTMQ